MNVEFRALLAAAMPIIEHSMKKKTVVAQVFFCVKMRALEEKRDMYADRDFKTKKQFKDAVAAGEKIRLYAPLGIGAPKANGREFVEGPQYPAPHQWYAEVIMKDGVVQKVK